MNAAAFAHTQQRTVTCAHVRIWHTHHKATGEQGDGAHDDADRQRKRH